jgi:hypothetical protein
MSPDTPPTKVSGIPTRAFLADLSRRLTAQLPSEHRQQWARS